MSWAIAMIFVLMETWVKYSTVCLLNGLMTSSLHHIACMHRIYFTELFLRIKQIKLNMLSHEDNFFIKNPWEYRTLLPRTDNRISQHGWKKTNIGPLSLKLLRSNALQQTVDEGRLEVHMTEALKFSLRLASRWNSLMMMMMMMMMTSPQSPIAISWRAIWCSYDATVYAVEYSFLFPVLQKS